jgi:hypothetical protein
MGPRRVGRARRGGLAGERVVSGAEDGLVRGSWSCASVPERSRWTSASAPKSAEPRELAALRQNLGSMCREVARRSVYLTSRSWRAHGSAARWRVLR